MGKIRHATVKAFEINEKKGNISGLKTFIGVALLIASQQLDLILDLSLNFPEWEFLDQARVILEQIIFYLEKALEILGSGFLGFGLLDKVRKFFRELL